jgi:Na+/H+-translocating membrane pyrophosphatase
MTKNSDKTSWTGAAAIAGAAIGSAALAAALLFVTRRKDVDKPTATPPRPEDAPETD